MIFLKLQIFFKLLRLFVLRSLKTERFLTVLSIIGIALGIGLFIGVKVASDRAITSFESDIKAINPSANYEVRDISGIDFDEKIYAGVKGVEDKSWPVLKTTAYIPGMKETLDLNGIYGFMPGTGFGQAFRSISGMEDFFTTPNGIIITGRFSRRHSLQPGDSLPVLVYDKAYSLKIIGLLDNDLVPENTAVMDLGNFQELSGKTGYLTRIDIEADEIHADEITKMLPPHLVLEKKELVVRNQQSLLKSFRYNLQFVSLIAILVGMFLLYNAVFISVVKKRTEIGILRGLGADKKTVVLLFICQGLILGITGSCLGILIGQAAAWFSVIAVQKTITAMYSAISITAFLVTGRDAAGAFAVGIAVSLIASAIPAFESARIRPHETSREGAFEGRYRKYYRVFMFAGLLLVFCGCMLALIDYRYTPYEFPFLSYAGIIFIMSGFTLISPLYLSAALKITKAPFEKMFGPAGVMTAGNMKGSTYRFSVALMSVAISCSLIIALLTLIFSLRYSLQEWIERNIAADIYVKPSACSSNFCYYPLSEDLVREIEKYPGVAAIDRFRTLRLDYKGRKIVAGFGDEKIRERFSRERGSRLHSLNEHDSGRPAMTVSISGYLAVKYNLKVGDTLSINTPKGLKQFIVDDTFSSYSTTSGFMYFDRRWLKKFWELDDTTQMALYVKKGVATETLIRKMKDELLPHYSIDIMNNRELRDRVFGIFNRTFAITYAIELISIIVSMIGVVNTLLALVLERKRDLSILRYLGGTWKQIERTLVLSAGIIGLTGILMGMVIGFMMSIIFIEVINKISFGWTILFHAPVLYLLLVTGLLFVTTLAAGFLPSRVARKIDPKRYISFE